LIRWRGYVDSAVITFPLGSFTPETRLGMLVLLPVNWTSGEDAWPEAPGTAAAHMPPLAVVTADAAQCRMACSHRGD